MTITNNTTTDQGTAYADTYGVRDALTATLLSVGGKDAMPVLQTVRIVAAGDTLTFTSTDRFRLTIASVPATGVAPFEALVSSDDAKRIVTALPKRSARRAYGTPPPSVAFRFDGVAVTVIAEGSTATLRHLDDQYPNVTNIVTGWTSAETDMIGVNPKFLADFAKMPRENAPAELQLAGNCKPMRSEWTAHGVNYLHIIMPVRINR